MEQSQWQRVSNLCQCNTEFLKNLCDFYSKINFPIKIRIHHAIWFESQNWVFDVNTMEGRQICEELFRQLTELIVMTLQELRSSGETFERYMDFELILSNLRKTFENNKGDFVEVVRRCLSEEKKLLDAYSANVESVPMTCDPQLQTSGENNELNLKLEALRRRMDEASSCIIETERDQESYIFRIRQIEAGVKDLQSRPGNEISKAQNLQNLNEEYLNLLQTNTQKINNMGSLQIHIAIDLAKQIKLIWEEIMRWRERERKVMTGLTTSVEGSLDRLDKLCSLGGELLYRMIDHIERSLVLCSKLPVIIDQVKIDLEKVLKELKDDYLPSYLRRAFVVEQNIPDRILKISGHKSANFSMSVRLLGGMSLGLGFSKPTVRMCVFYENDMPESDEYCKSQYDLENGSERPFVMNSSCVAHFHSMRLKSFKRPNIRPPVTNEEQLVTEQKFGFIFYTTINICNQSYPIKVVSLPVVFISQTSQEIMAKGTLIWDAAFSNEVRHPYPCRDKVYWMEVASVLTSLFCVHTGRGLTEDHLKYLAKMAMKLKHPDADDLSGFQITDKEIIKDKLDGHDFSFWKWFWACMNLTKDVVRKEWNDGLIYGFISKEDARNKLINNSCGTFLLRFSEGNIDSCQKANLCGYLTLAVIEKDPGTGERKLYHVKDYLESKSIQDKKGLFVILDAMEVIDHERSTPENKQTKKLLRYLWPDTNTVFQDRFKIEQQDKRKGTGEASGSGYISATIKIEVNLGGSQQPSAASRTNARQESVDSNSGIYQLPNSPGSAAFSPSSLNPPSVNSDDGSVMLGASRPVNAVLPIMYNHNDQISNGLLSFGDSVLPGTEFDDIGGTDNDIDLDFDN